VRPATTTTRVGDTAPAAPAFVVTYVSTFGAGGVRLIDGSGAGRGDLIAVWRKIASDNPGYARPKPPFSSPTWYNAFSIHPRLLEHTGWRNSRPVLLLQSRTLFHTMKFCHIFAIILGRFQIVLGPIRHLRIVGPS
jgi:hypothetical protein